MKRVASGTAEPSSTPYAVTDRARKATRVAAASGAKGSKRPATSIPTGTADMPDNSTPAAATSHSRERCMAGGGGGEAGVGGLERDWSAENAGEVRWRGRGGNQKGRIGRENAGGQRR